MEQNYFIWHEKKRWNVRHVMGKVKKKVNLGVLRMDSQDLKGYPTHAWTQLSKLTSWKWIKHFKWGTRKGTKFYTCLLQIGRERRIPLINMNPHGILISGQRMGDLNLSWWWIQISKHSQDKCFLFEMAITRSMFGCHTSIMSTMRMHLGIYSFPYCWMYIPFLVELFNMLIKLLHWFPFVHFSCLLCSCNNASYCKAMELDHAKPNLVHDFFQI